MSSSEITSIIIAQIITDLMKTYVFTPACRQAGMITDICDHLVSFNLCPSVHMFFLTIRKMNAEIISIGTEILLGHIVNSNAAYLSRQLAGLGIDVFYHSTVGDNKARLAEAIRRGLARSDVVITTGGLGPTEDDITVKTIADATGKKLVFDKTVAKRIDSHFARCKIKTPKINYRQAYIPEGAKALKNDVGTAPGLILKLGTKIIIALPGPPRELIPIFEQSIIPYLKQNFPSKHIIVSRVIKTTGLPESAVCPKVSSFLKMGPEVTVGIYAHVGQVDLKVTAKAKNKNEADKKIEMVEKRIKGRLGNIVFGTDDETLESVVGKLLLKQKKTLSIAESCTGGLVANRITNVSGSSKYFLIGVTAYSNQAKTMFLNVPKDMIARYGAVSTQVAVAMAKGAREIAQTDLAIGITGIAGPTGGTKKKPVGTVFVVITGTVPTQKVTPNRDCPPRVICKQFHFAGSRQDIKFLTSQAALDMVRRYLLGKNYV